MGQIIRRGEIVIAPVMFSDLSTYKIRPILILFEHEADIVACAITSTKTDVEIQLNNKASFVKWTFLVTIQKDHIIKKAGEVSEEIYSAVSQKIVNKIVAKEL